MSILTIISVVVFVSFAVLNRIQTKSVSEPIASPVVMSDTDEVGTPVDPSLDVTQSSSPSPKPESTSSSDAKININVDTNLGNTTSARETLVYPGAQKIRTGGSADIYSTSADGDSVYNWYKSEMEKRSYTIRNNVRTKANDKFKAVLQGVSGTASFKVTIDQENSAASTLTTLE